MKVVPALAVFVLSVPAMADYHSSLEAGYAKSDYKESFSGGSTKVEYQSYSLSGTYFFNGVSTESVPLYEAAFLSKSSAIGVSFARIDSTTSITFDSDEFKYSYDISSKSISGFGVVNDFVIGGSITSFEYDDYLDTTDITVDLGYYITDTSNISVYFTREEYDGFGVEETDNYYGVTYHGVYSNQWAVTLAYDIMDESKSYTLGGSYFFTQRMGLSGAYTGYSSDDDDDLTSYALEFHYFINDMHGLFVGVGRDDFEDYESNSISLRYRLNI